MRYSIWKCGCTQCWIQPRLEQFHILWPWKGHSGHKYFDMVLLNSLAKWKHHGSNISYIKVCAGRMWSLFSNGHLDLSGISMATFIDKNRRHEDSCSTCGDQGLRAPNINSTVQGRIGNTIKKLGPSMFDVESQNLHFDSLPFVTFTFELWSWNLNQ